MNVKHCATRLRATLGLAAVLAVSVLLAGCDQPSEAPRSGFAGLGADAAAFAQVERGKPLRFPADHGPHDGYRIEWWYVTANLKDASGKEWGVQWTLFRSALRPGADVDGFGSPNVWMGHAGLTSPTGHRYAEILARGGIGQAGVTAAPFRAWIDNWQLQTSGGPDIDQLNMQAAGKDFSYQLQLSTNRPLVLHGEGGYSEKSGLGQASYFYSQPFYTVAGDIVVDGNKVPVTGTAWLDREWSSQPLAATQQGWDWFSLHLDSGAKLMLFQVRQTDGPAYRAGTWIAADGTPRALRGDQIQLDPGASARQDTGRKVPTQWRVRVPDMQVDVTAEAIQPRAWMGTSFPYWEGPVRLRAGQGGAPAGRGYLEMTGY